MEKEFCDEPSFENYPNGPKPIQTGNVNLNTGSNVISEHIALALRHKTATELLGASLVVLNEMQNRRIKTKLSDDTYQLASMISQFLNPREVKTENKDLKTAINLLRTLKKDAQMAISGDWDISGHGIGLNDNAKEGFEAQISLIDEFLNNLKK